VTPAPAEAEKSEAEGDEPVLTSRWSPDSSPEPLSKMKRVKKVLSLARLRPRKSKAALARAAANEADG
jgi:hypothetical protein